MSAIVPAASILAVNKAIEEKEVKLLIWRSSDCHTALHAMKGVATVNQKMQKLKSRKFLLTRFGTIQIWIHKQLYGIQHQQ